MTQIAAPAMPSEPIVTGSEVAAVKPVVKERLLFPGPVRAHAMSIVVMTHVAAVLAPHYNTISPADWRIAGFYHAFSKAGAWGSRLTGRALARWSASR